MAMFFVFALPFGLPQFIAFHGLSNCLSSSASPFFERGKPPWAPMGPHVNSIITLQVVIVSVAI